LNELRGEGSLVGLLSLYDTNLFHLYQNK
jgi:hypothetical protein